MGRVEACRICLITDVKMERIQGSLENNIKSVFGHNVLYSSDLPDYSCYECTALITKFSKFRRKYLKAQSLLFNILQNHGVVTEKEIKNIDRSACKLNSNMSIKHIENNTALLEVKIECDPMEGVPDMTVESADEELNDSSSEDDIPISSVKSVEHVNEKNKYHTSLRKTKNTVQETVSGEPSNKMKKLKGNKCRQENILKDLGVTKHTDGADANTVIYLQAEDFQNELTDIDNTFEEHDPASALSNQILENQNLMISNQHIIMSKLADFSVRFEGLNKTNMLPTTFLTHESPADKVNCPVIETKEQLDEFENDLKDPEKKKILRSKYAIFFKGRGHGVNCAYILIDALFSRKFLTTVSWTGGSRGEECKIALKVYNNTINFIYELVQECDSNFSLLDCYRFMKCILRNSVKRCQSKGLRMSTSKRRARTKKVLGVEKNGGIDSENVKSNESDGLEET